MVVVRAEIVAVGSEMLTPTHLDTNSLVITERLNELGIDLQGKAVAGDDRDALKAIVADALRRSDLLILTGGLGPTDDDLTRDVVADVVGLPLEYHAEIFDGIARRFAARGMPTPEINRRQAMVPSGAGPANRTARRRGCGSSTIESSSSSCRGRRAN
jgi:nicotinamide-nucleotide amidase